MPTFGPYAVQSGSDDGHFQSTGTAFSSSANPYRADSNTATSNQYTAFIRFDSVAVPAGATINSATLTVTPNTTSNDDPNLDIYGVDADDTAAPTSDTEGDALVRTTATVAWVATGVGDTGADSPDISTIVQEIVDRGGWATGQAMMFLLEGRSDFNSNFRLDGFENGTGIATLTIDYTAASGGPSGSPLVSPFFRNPTQSPFIRV